MASKVVVVGPPSGSLPAIIKKLTTLHSKNAFALAIILGDLFADASPSEDELTALLDNSYPVPLPTYFTLGSQPLPQQVIDRLSANADELIPNLYFVGKRTTLTTSEGIKLVALGGLPSPSTQTGISKDKYTPFYTIEDAKSLRGANNADILFTSSWPASVRSGSKVALPPEAENLPSSAEDQAISDLCSTLRPRYHFSSSPTFFFEREPFYFPPIDPATAPTARQITRFISLASSTNTTKQKSIYAFSIDPQAAPVTSLPPGATPSPFSAPVKKRGPPLPSADKSNYSHKHQKRRRGHPAPPPGPDQCFFCLSNPNLATHLVTSIASDSYLTIAKGPLTSNRDATTPLPFPTHILIIPLAHSPTLSSISDNNVTRKEMHRYRRALQSLIQRRGEGKWGAVTWEVSREGGIHDHWQFLAIDAELVRKGLVEAAFKVEVENEKWPTKFEKANITTGPDAGSYEEEEARQDSQRNDFLRIWMWAPPSPSSSDTNGHPTTTEADASATPSAELSSSLETPKSLILPISEDFRFDLQFGRRVLAKLTGGTGAAWNWRDCLQSQEEEVADAEAFKKAFEEVDPTKDA
ncbi:MAG: hypothetical protein M4579_004843 [Chaenotheca gracillima]|nr:MAG: hypothetical protein M4579_004843 [Chaenotheca gracillima]